MLASALPFYYALIDAIVSLSRDETISIRRSLTSALRAFPALLASEILTLLVVVMLFLIAVPLITVGSLAGIIEVIIGSPALVLVVPVYYFTSRVYVLDRIWNVVKNNPGGYIVLGLIGLLFVGLSEL
jgi:hypothetical protein